MCANKCYPQSKYNSSVIYIIKIGLVCTNIIANLALSPCLKEETFYALGQMCTT